MSRNTSSRACLAWRFGLKFGGTAPARLKQALRQTGEPCHPPAPIPPALRLPGFLPDFYAHALEFYRIFTCPLLRLKTREANLRPGLGQSPDPARAGSLTWAWTEICGTISCGWRLARLPCSLSCSWRAGLGQAIKTTKDWPSARRKSSWSPRCVWIWRGNPRPRKARSWPRAIKSPASSRPRPRPL